MDDRVIAREVAMVASCLNIIFVGRWESQAMCSNGRFDRHKMGGLTSSDVTSSVDSLAPSVEKHRSLHA